MKVQITKQTGALCDESGRPLPAEIAEEASRGLGLGADALASALAEVGL